MSTLDRADEIENDFYYLKSVEWGCSKSAAKSAIERAMKRLSGHFQREMSMSLEDKAVRARAGYQAYLMHGNQHGKPQR